MTDPFLFVSQINIVTIYPGMTLILRVICVYQGYFCRYFPFVYEAIFCTFLNLLNLKTIFFVQQFLIRIDRLVL